MSKSVTFKEALKKWESRKGIKGVDAKEVKLNGNSPPIGLLDPSVSQLVNCEKLSLSTNFIEKLNNLNGLRSLKCLSLGRNWIKSLYGLEVLGETLEELWISYNAIEKMKGIGSLLKLRVLYMSNNLVREWPEFLKLNELTQLEDLNFVGNPIEEKHSATGDWREKVTDVVPSLKRLDGYPVIKKEVDVERSASICGTLT